MIFAGVWLDFLLLILLGAVFALLYRLSTPAPAYVDGPLDDEDDDYGEDFRDRYDRDRAYDADPGYEVDPVYEREPTYERASARGDRWRRFAEPPPWLRSRFPGIARQAGFDPGRLRFFYWLAKLGLLLLLPLLLLELWPTRLAAPHGGAVLLAAALGFFLPDVWLRLRRRARQRKIRRSLSFALDLLVALLHSGIGIEEALRRVGREGLPAGDPLGDELILVAIEIDAGKERTAAFGALARRTGVAELRAVAAALRLAARHGLSVNAALETQADLLRTKRRERARQEVAAAATKAIFPVFLIGFPLFMVIVFFPAVLELVETVRLLVGG